MHLQPIPLRILTRLVSRIGLPHRVVLSLQGVWLDLDSGLNFTCAVREISFKDAMMYIAQAVAHDTLPVFASFEPLPSV